MTPDPTGIPDDAVEIVHTALCGRPNLSNWCDAREAVAALAAAGWLHDPAELDAARAKLSRFREAVEAGHVPSALSDLYPEDNVRFCDLDNERWPCTAACPIPED